MNICFRVDASIKMGTGHVMRCLTLAGALKRQGANTYFICREHDGHLSHHIKSLGHPVYLLPYSEQEDIKEQKLVDDIFHASWLGITQEEDAKLSIPIIEKLNPDWLIVDHYALDLRWEKELRPYCKKMMVIDDLADRQHDCELLLDQTFGRDSKNYSTLVPSACDLFCGAEYALLRPEFSQWREYSLSRRSGAEINHLLINLGGVDKDNITTKILKSLVKSPLPPSCRITVVMGATAPWISDVKKQAEIMPWKTDVKVGVKNMAELMANSDLAIGAAGATSWERCCLGLPTVLVVLAENQKFIAHKLQSVGAALMLEKGSINSEDLHACIDKLVNDPINLINLGNMAATIVNGAGVSEILTRILHR